MLQIITALALIVNGLLAGGSFDTSLVKLPTRRRIGNIAYAVFARGNDLGNGLIVYPVLAASAALLVFIATIMGVVQQQPTHVLLPLIIASVASVLHFITTSQAAPVMLSLKDTPDDEPLLKEKLDKFERRHAVRMVLQVFTFVVLVWALISVQV